MKYFKSYKDIHFNQRTIKTIILEILTVSGIAFMLLFWMIIL